MSSRAPTAASRGLVLKLDEARHTATFSASYGEQKNLASDYMGSLEPLPGGVIAVGFAYVLRGRGGGRSGVAAAQGTLGADWHPGPEPRS